MPAGTSWQSSVPNAPMQRAQVRSQVGKLRSVVRELRSLMLHNAAKNRKKTFKKERPTILMRTGNATQYSGRVYMGKES